MELGLTVPQRKWYHRKRVVAGLLASVIGIACVTTYVQSSEQPKLRFAMMRVDDFQNGPQLKAQLYAANARYEAKRRGNLTEAPLQLEEYSSKCYSWTGGTCRFSGCIESRKATCVHKWFQGFFCLCPDGMCAGADGTCYAGHYEKVAHAVEIKNVQWPKEAVYFPRNLLLRGVGYSQNADANGWDDKFDIYRLPGIIKANSNPQIEFLVTSTTQPDYIAFAQNPVVMIKLDRFWNDIQMASTIICKTPNGGATYQFGSYAGYIANAIGFGSLSINWWYISYANPVGGLNGWSSGSPGPQGEWTTSPSWDDSMLHTCA